MCHILGISRSVNLKKTNPEIVLLWQFWCRTYIEHLKYGYHVSKHEGVFYLNDKIITHVTSSAEIYVGFFQESCFWIFLVFGFCPWFPDRGLVNTKLEIARIPTACFFNFDRIKKYWCLGPKYHLSMINTKRILFYYVFFSL